MITADLAQRRVALGIGSIESARRIALSAIVRMVRNDRFQALPLRYDADSPPHGGSAATASLPPKGEPVSKQDATDKRDFPVISCSCVVLCVALRCVMCLVGRRTYVWCGRRRRACCVAVAVARVVSRCVCASRFVWCVAVCGRCVCRAVCGV